MVSIFNGCPDTQSSADDHDGESTIKLVDAFPYCLSQPGASFSLPRDLQEISGIDWVKPGILACIQDEEAKIYLFDLTTADVIKSIDFGRDGDYEGLAVNHSSAYVLESNGTVYVCNGFPSICEGKVKRINTFLKKTNDPEGLAFDSENSRLLIACKGAPYPDSIDRNHKAVYAFNLNTGQLTTTPVYLIDLQALRDSLKQSGFVRASEDVASFFNPVFGDPTFQPSGVAVHPHTQEIYILASVGKMLLVLNQDGSISDCVKLDRKLFPQPEGICFSPEGDLFISNEGKGGSASILQFSYKGVQ